MQISCPMFVCSRINENTLFIISRLGAYAASKLSACKISSASWSYMFSVQHSCQLHCPRPHSLTAITSKKLPPWDVCEREGARLLRSVLRGPGNSVCLLFSERLCFFLSNVPEKPVAELRCWRMPRPLSILTFISGTRGQKNKELYVEYSEYHSSKTKEANSLTYA